MAFRVLLIEPDEDVRMGAAEVYAIYGVQCITAASFSEAEHVFNGSVIFDSVVSAGVQYSGGKLGDCVRFITKPYTADVLLKVSGVVKH